MTVYHHHYRHHHCRRHGDCVNWQATKDLEDIDEKRRKEFKNYELEKEHLRRKELEQMDEAKRAEAEKKFDAQKKKHADHPKLHHPVRCRTFQFIMCLLYWCVRMKGLRWRESWPHYELSLSVEVYCMLRAVLFF